MVYSCLRLGAAAALLAQPVSSQDGTGALALGGASGGGLLDVDGLQSSLKSGGVEGLNKMLQAMAAANGVHSGEDASAHVTKDASGNAMYDFRDVGGAPKTAPVAGQAADPLPPAAKQQSAPQAPLTSSDRSDDELPMPDFGIVESPKTQKPRVVVRSLVAAKVASKKPVAPTSQDEDDDDDDDEDQMKAAPAEQESHLIVWPPPAQPVAASHVKAAVAHLPPAAAVAIVPEAVAAIREAASSAKPSQPSAPQVPQVQQASKDEATAGALAKGLEAMRQNLDTLLGEADTMLHTHHKLSEPAPTAALPMEAPSSSSIGAAGGAAGAEILNRLQALEDENARMKSKEAAQALRLDAVEAKEQKDSVALKKVEQENAKLRGQAKAAQSAAFLQDTKTPGSSQMKWGIKTFFHKKEKLRRH